MQDHDDPFERFAAVMAAAEVTGIDDPNAMTVASVGPDGRPSTRVVLLKAFDEHGFVFYTNLQSRKGTQILAHPHVSLNFWWRELRQQVVIEGAAELVDDAEADAYFASRARGSKLGAWASRQSRPMKNRAELLKEVAKVEAKYLTRKVPRPPHWSGLRVVPDYFEFWVAGTFRLHDRTVYRRADDGSWAHHKVFP